MIKIVLSDKISFADEIEKLLPFEVEWEYRNDIYFPIVVDNPVRFLISKSCLMGKDLKILYVDKIKNKRGYALFPVRLGVVGADAPARTVAHEILHLCGLTHSDDGENIMKPGDSGTKLNKVQKVVSSIVRKVWL